MSVSQAEYNAFKADIAASLAQLEKFANDANGDTAAVKAAINDLQANYSTISLQAAPWSAAISAEVQASEGKASEALSKVRALYDATKAELESLKQ